MRGLHRFSIRHPILVVAITIVGTIAIAPGMLRLRLRTDGNALVPEHTPEIQLDRQVRHDFGVHDPLVVLIRPRHPDGIFNPRTLHLVADLTTAFGRMPDLDPSSVRSLATEISDHLRPDTFAYRRLLEPLPETPEQLKTLRGDLQAIGLLTGTLVSFDGKATALLVGVPESLNRTTFLAQVEDAIARADTTGHEVDVIGAPAAEALLGMHILRDLGVSRGPTGELTARASDRTPEGSGWLSRLRAAIARHIGLLPLSIAFMALVFVLSFRSLWAPVIPLAQAAACLVFVLGLMGWTGVPLYLTMAVLPVILVTLGLTDAIHIFNCYSRHRVAQPAGSVADAVRAAMEEMYFPVMGSDLTTAVGFLSFAISPLAPIRAFGWFTAIGLVFCLLWTLTVLPASLVLLAPRGTRTPGRPALASGGSSSGVWRMYARFSGRRPAVTLALVALALALSPFGIRRLAVQDSWIGGFARDSEFYRATQYFNAHFFGTHMLRLVLDTGHVELRGTVVTADLGPHELRLPPDRVADPASLIGCALVVTRSPEASAAALAISHAYRPDGWESVVESARLERGHLVLTTPIVHGSALFLLAPARGETLHYALDSHRLAVPEVLEQVGDLERFVRAQGRYTVGGALGPADMIETAEFLANQRAPGLRAIPGNPDRLRWLWSVLEQAQGSRRVHEVVEPRLERGLVTVFLKNANFVDTARLMAALREYERANLTPRRIRFDFAGDVAVSQTMIGAIVRSQVGSLLSSLLGVLAVTAFVFRSLRWGLVCILPPGLAVSVTFAVMGWTGMPLGVATSMFASMVLGVGVDFAIHLVSYYRAAAAPTAYREAAVSESLVTIGPPIMTHALAVTFGFGILVLSQVPANAQLGAITVVSLLSCLAATLLVIPTLLRVGGRSGRASASPAD